MVRAAGMPISRFVLQRILTPVSVTTDANQSALPEHAQWDQLHAVLTLMRIAEDNMTRRGDAERLRAIQKQIEERITA